MTKYYHFNKRSFVPRFMVFFCVVLILSGCRTIAPVGQGRNETSQEAQEALSAVAGAISGKPLSDEDLRNLEKQIREDEEAQTAVQAITQSVGGKAPVVKYCPIDGKRYAPHMEICPEHQVPLETVSP
ncbi:MAG TPA: hypothetical protein PKV41_06465 [Candidatus Omnitrophota bacterium]|nr:hypothetical protein [Candidatus Omnitrophota bacterium]